MDKLTIRRGLLARLIYGQASSALTAAPGEILVATSNSARRIPTQALSAPLRVVRGRFWAAVEISTGAAQESLCGFAEERAAEFVNHVNLAMRREVEARLQGPYLELAAAATAAHSVLDGRRYTRHSEREVIRAKAAQALAITRNPFWAKYASSSQRRTQQQLESFAAGLDALVDQSNETFVAAELERFRPLFDSIESKPLTAAQRRACVVNDDRNLVLAGAGTGKTSTMIGRAGYLLASGQVLPDQMLMLAYGRKAAEEMQGRQDSRLRPLLESGTPTIKTFHALGLEIVGKAEGRRPDITRLAEDSHAMAQFIDAIVAERCRDADYRSKLIRYLGSERYPYRSPFDFASMEEYQAYVRENELRTLAGQVVKSFEEVVISNWLTAMGVAFEYERSYEVETWTDEHRQYKPDFYLTDYGIYIEHFALDEEGNPPTHFKGYAEGVAWKRALHEENDTRLLETHSYMKRAGVLESTLEHKLLEAGVEFDPLNEDELLGQLREMSQVSEFAELLGQFLGLYKQADVDMPTLWTRANADVDRSRSLLLLELFAPVLKAYEEHLRERGEIDFGDMIHRATMHVQNGAYESPFTHILVDEFQDISAGRANLVLALMNQRPQTTLFAVSDDWQAIYRFAGSDIGYTTQFEQRFGPAATTALDLTFRFNDKISELASQFVLRNPSQVAKSISSLNTTPAPAVSLVRMTSAETGLHLALDAIAARSSYGDPKPTTVLVLARFNFVLDEMRSREARAELRQRYPNLKVDFMTVHSAKGKEADFVVVLGLGKGKFGFPSEHKGDPVLEFLLPRREPFAYTEERRLFYVAATRARHRAYLVYNPLEASVFVTELLDPRNGYPVCTDEFDETLLCAEVPVVSCPSCKTGSLVPKQGKNGTFIACNHYPYCKYTEPGCPTCGAAMRKAAAGRTCANPACGTVVPTCPSCGGSLVERVGPWGRFLGCTNYRGTSGGTSCTYTTPAKTA